MLRHDVNQDSSWPDWLRVRESLQLQLRKWPCALQLLASATGHQMQVSSMAYSAAVNACSAAKGSRWPWIVTLPQLRPRKMVLGRLVSFWDCFRDYVPFRRCSLGTYFGFVLWLWETWRFQRAKNSVQRWTPFKDSDAVAILIECCSPRWIEWNWARFLSGIR